MKIIVNALLCAPTNKLWVGGGGNPPLGLRNYSINLTPEILEQLLMGQLFQNGIQFSLTHPRYKAKNGTVSVKGYLPKQKTLKKIRDLEKEGWFFNRTKARLYELEW